MHLKTATLPLMAFWSSTRTVYGSRRTTGRGQRGVQCLSWKTTQAEFRQTTSLKCKVNFQGYNKSIGGRDIQRGEGKQKTDQPWCGHLGSWFSLRGSPLCNSKCCRGWVCWSWKGGCGRSEGCHWGAHGGSLAHHRSPHRWPGTSAVRQGARLQRDRAPMSLWCWQTLPLAQMHWQNISWNVDLHRKLQREREREKNKITKL